MIIYKTTNLLNGINMYNKFIKKEIDKFGNLF